MKHLYITLIVVTLLILCVLISLYLTGNISVEHMVLATAVMNGMGIMGFCIIKLQTTEKTKEQNTSESQIIETPVSTEEEKKSDISPDSSIKQKWSKSMYMAYADRWNEVFENIKYPIEETAKSEIGVLCWDIASKTMDYLLVENDDPNVLERNRNGVDAVLSEKKLSEMELKEYFDDPSTVPAKVIGVHDALSSQLTKDQCFSTQVFGYLVKLSSKHE